MFISNSFKTHQNIQKVGSPAIQSEFFGLWVYLQINPILLGIQTGMYFPPFSIYSLNQWTRLLHYEGHTRTAAFYRNNKNHRTFTDSIGTNVRDYS